MKKIISIVLLAISLTSYSQTTLDSLVLKKINEYRKSKGVSELKWGDVNLQNAAEHHSDYLYSINLSKLEHAKQINMTPRDQANIEFVRGHEEEIPSKAVKSQSSKQRFEIYDFMRENVATVFGYMNAGNETFAKNIVDSWIESPSHNATLLHPNMKFAGVSTKVFVLDVKKSTMVTIEGLKKQFHTTEINNAYIVSTLTVK